jgi:lysophospholipase L1-like esterase
MRKTISEAVKQLQTAGAKNLYYRDGLKLFGPAFDPFMPDHLHPDEEGYRRLAERFIIQTKSYFNPDP